MSEGLALTSHNAGREHEDVDGGGESAEDEGHTADDAPRYADCPASELIR